MSPWQSESRPVASNEREVIIWATRAFSYFSLVGFSLNKTLMILKKNMNVVGLKMAKIAKKCLTLIFFESIIVLSGANPTKGKNSPEDN